MTNPKSLFWYLLVILGYSRMCLTAGGYAKLPNINVFVAKGIWAEGLQGLEPYTRLLGDPHGRGSNRMHG